MHSRNAVIKRVGKGATFTKTELVELSYSEAS